MRNLEAWYAAQADVPGIEVHRDPDITWMLSNGATGPTAGRPSASRRRLHVSGSTKSTNGSPNTAAASVFGSMTTPLPPNLTNHLEDLGLRCKKRFPGMRCDLSQVPKIPVPEGIRIIRTPHHSMYLRHPHPYFGPITTAIRRHELNRLAHLAAQWPDRFFDFVALDRAIVRSAPAVMFVNDSVAGLYDAGVLEEARGRGIGSAMLAHRLPRRRAAPQVRGGRYRSNLAVRVKIVFSMHSKTRRIGTPVKRFDRFQQPGLRSHR